MSGLIGLVNFSPDQLDLMSQGIAARVCRFKWNTWDWWTSADRTIALGRVDIGTLNPTSQPIVSLDGQVVVLFSGKLYRTEELKCELEAQGCHFLRFDDPELVLNAYLIYGFEFISRLEGVFHLAILDQNTQELLIANDRFGLRPLYWTQYQGRFAFAPEVKALLVDPAFEKKLDLTAVAEYLRFQVLLGDKTFIQGVSLLPGASLLRYCLTDKQLTITPYWSFADIPVLDPKTPYAEIVEESARLFQQAVDTRLTTSSQVGLYLTGGLDSRLIAACLAKNSSDFVTASYGSKDSIDVLLAKRMAALLGSKHHFIEFTGGRWVQEYADLHLDLVEGHHSWVHMHGISTLVEVRSLLNVNFTGWGVGSTMGAHWWDPILDEVVDKLDFECLMFHYYNQKHTYPGLTEAEENNLYIEEYRPKIRGLAFESLCSELRRLENYPFDQRADYFNIQNHERRLTYNFVVFNSSHFENSIPGFDYRLFDFMHSFPMAWRMNPPTKSANGGHAAPRAFSELWSPNRYKVLQQDVIEYLDPRLAMIPRSKDGLLFTRRRGRRITHHIIARVKQRTNRHIAPIFQQPSPDYADYENWLRNDLREWATNLLLDGQLTNRGMFNVEFAKSLLERNFSGRERHAIGKIAPLITFEMFLRKYFD